MEENDEIHPQKSPESGSPTNDGGMAVTQAASPPPQNIVTLALPAQQPKNGGGREDFWSESATAVLIEAWGERYLELSRGNLKQKHWKEVADIINGAEDLTKTPKTDIQCKNRIDTVKKKYKIEKAKIAGGGGPSKWRFFQRFDYLIGPTPKSAGSSGPVAATPIMQIKKSPLGIPGRIPSKSRSRIHQDGLLQKEFIFQKRHLHSQDGLASDSSTSGRDAASPASSDSFPPFIQNKKRVKIHKQMNSNESAVAKAEKNKNGKRGEMPENLTRELTNALLKFGEAYEITERSKLKQAVEMEKQRMKFIKELEMQKMEFFIKTQKEISQLKLGKSFK